ncbi:cellulose binding domain-containing protein [Glycomyces tenuis]|uniref:cellulose binding domain-containing protein n=1 Tax=Glycomyces tenuis TaxID=58116 RepID=UPI0004092A30|nr:cellulose binding domain-containing protein [Glycomyces tenuis]
MRPLHGLARTALAVLAGLLLAGALAAPAAAEHPEQAPTPFYNSALGDDGCSLFETTGAASWPAVHPPETPRVVISGMAAVTGSQTGEICLPVVPPDRRIEFTGHVNDWPAVEHVVPLPYDSPGFEYEFALEAPGGSEIEYVTMRICKERLPDGSDWTGRCGENVLTEQGGGASDHCQFAVMITNAWGSGYTAQVTITAIEPISDWHAIIAFPGDQSLRQMWNANASQSGSDLTVTPAPWNQQIPSGGSVTFGFVVSGPSQPPPQIAVWADGHRCAQVL